MEKFQKETNVQAPDLSFILEKNGKWVLKHLRLTCTVFGLTDILNNTGSTNSASRETCVK